MIYEFMRLVLFFDLPMKTKKEVKIYTHMRIIVFFDLPVTTAKSRRDYYIFRKYLIKNGYMMMQFSVYCKIFPNREAAVKHVNILKKNVPKEGQIRLLLVTEKQYSKIEIIVGGVSNQEKTVNADSESINIKKRK